MAVAAGVALFKVIGGLYVSGNVRVGDAAAAGVAVPVAPGVGDFNVSGGLYVSGNVRAGDAVGVSASFRNAGPLCFPAGVGDFSVTGAL